MRKSDVEMRLRSILTAIKSGQLDWALKHAEEGLREAKLPEIHSPLSMRDVFERLQEIRRTCEGEGFTGDLAVQCAFMLGSLMGEMEVGLLLAESGITVDQKHGA